MKKYSVEIRMHALDSTKYLIESNDFNNFIEAFYTAKTAAESVSRDYFVQIVDNSIKEVIALFPNSANR